MCYSGRLRERSFELLAEQDATPTGLWPWLWGHEYPEVNRQAVLVSYCEADVRRWDADEDAPVELRAGFRRGLVAELVGVRPREFLPQAEAVVADCPGLESIELLTDGADLVMRTGVSEVTLWVGEFSRRFPLPAPEIERLSALPTQDELTAALLSRWLGV